MCRRLWKYFVLGRAAELSVEEGRAAAVSSLFYFALGCDWSFALLACFVHRIAKRDISLFFTCAPNQNGLGARTNIIDVDSNQLRVANSATVKQLQHQAVAFRKGCNLGHLAIEH